MQNEVDDVGTSKPMQIIYTGKVNQSSQPVMSVPSSRTEDVANSAAKNIATRDGSFVPSPADHLHKIKNGNDLVVTSSAGSSNGATRLTALPSGLSNRTIGLLARDAPNTKSQVSIGIYGGSDESIEGYNATYCVQVLENNLPALTKESVLTPVEFARIALIRQAATQRDYFYLILHQCICLGALGHNSIFQNMPNATEAFGIIDSILSPSSNLRPDLLLFFAGFPMRLSETQTRYPQMYAHEIDKICRFLVALRINFHQFEQSCKSVKLPPMAHHISNVIDVPSPILQQLLFTAIFRNIWRSTDQLFERTVTDLFVSFQTQYLLSKRPDSLGNTYYFDAAKSERSFSNQFRNSARRSIVASNYRIGSGLISQNLNSGQSQPVSTGTDNPTSQLYQLRRDAPQQPSSAHRSCSSSEVGSISAIRHDLQRSQNYGNAIPLREAQNPRNEANQLSVPHGGYNHQNYVQLANCRHGTGSIPRQNARSISISSSLEPQHVTVALQRPSVQNQILSGRSQAPTHLDCKNASSSFIPPAGRPRRQRARSYPEITALHQAHLMDSAWTIALTGIASPQKICQQVARHCMLPSRLDINRPVNSWSFTVVDRNNLACSQAQAIGGKPIRSDPKRCLATRYRLRCSSKATSVKIPPQEEQSWTTSKNSWPAFLYVKVNEHLLEYQRKLDHGRDIPVDISEFVQDGVNVVKAYVNLKKDTSMKTDYYIFVEEIETAKIESVREAVLAQKLSPESFVSEVRQSLKNRWDRDKQSEGSDENASHISTEGDDGDLVVLGSTSTVINMFDPILPSRPLEIPVRGKYCLHRDCFDLDTFFESRPFQNRQCCCRYHHQGSDHQNENGNGNDVLNNSGNCPGCNGVDETTGDCTVGQSLAISAIDKWNCPLCRGDARPKSLVVDEYLLAVKAQLAQDNMLDTTRSIRIDANGKWEALNQNVLVEKRKVEETTIIDLNGDDNEDDDRDCGHDHDHDSDDSLPLKSRRRFKRGRRSLQIAQITKEPVFIELSD